MVWVVVEVRYAKQLCYVQVVTTVFCETLDVALRICVKPQRMGQDLHPWWQDECVLSQQ